MRVCCLQHAEHEDLGSLEPWLAARGYPLLRLRMYADQPPPRPEAFDWLILLGGPMNVDDHAEYPWLVAEKALLRNALAAGKRVLGICLGAQLLAQALGGTVGAHRNAEIGWFPVQLTAEGRAHPWCAELPERFCAFHWHGDTYTLPVGATRLAYSEACAEQAFAAGDRVLGLQFHLEVTEADARRWLQCDPPAAGRYVQSAEEILSCPQRFSQSNRWLGALLERFLAG